MGRSGWQQQADARRVLRRHGRICHVCGLGGADQVDHVIPTFEGGPDTDENKRPIHSEPCHEEKTKAEAVRARMPR
ncbi:MAG: HNH endonuclease [Chloroflexi bacterium]|nr:HNH endonuclease [Chloroflexota bacterium]